MLRAGRPRLLRRFTGKLVEGSIPQRASLSGISRLYAAAAIKL